MKFNYEFEFDVDEFVDWYEEDFLEYARDLNVYRECADKDWIKDKLYDYCCDTSCPSIFIISQDIEDNAEKYYPQIVDEVYEIFKKKHEEIEEEKKKIMEHLCFIRDYCEKQCDCLKCPIQKICESGTIRDWRFK